MDILNDFIKQNFGGKSICELAQIEQKLQDVKELLKWIDKCSVLEGKLLKKDGEIALYEEALEVACGEVEYYTEIRFLYSCEAFGFENKRYNCDNNCGVCLKTYFLKRGQENIDREKNNQAVHDEMEKEEQNVKIKS